MRDSQRSKIYNAEQETGFQYSNERELLTTDECLKFVRFTLNNVWVRMDFGESFCRSIAKDIRIIETRRRTWAHAKGWCMSILLPYRNWAWNQTTLLHELAHIVTFWLWRPDGLKTIGRNPIASHGPEWCWVYLRLLRHCGSPNEWALMQRLFQLHGVRFYRESPLRKAAQKGE